MQAASAISEDVESQHAGVWVHYIYGFRGLVWYSLNAAIWMKLKIVCISSGKGWKYLPDSEYKTDIGRKCLYLFYIIDYQIYLLYVKGILVLLDRKWNRFAPIE